MNKAGLNNLSSGGAGLMNPRRFQETTPSSSTLTSSSENFTPGQRKVIREIVASTLKSCGILGRLNARSELLVDNIIEDSAFVEESTNLALTHICNPVSLRKRLQDNYPILFFVR